MDLERTRQPASAEPWSSRLRRYLRLAPISSAARALEQNVQLIIEAAADGDGGAGKARETDDLSALTAALSVAAASVEATVEEAPTWGFAAPTSIGENADGKRILVVDDDRETAEALAARIRLFGYRADTVCELDGLAAAVAEAPPAVVVMDLMFPEGGLAGAKAMREMQSAREAPLPVVFASARNDLAGRVESVRAGGRAFFAKPRRRDVAGRGARSIERPQRAGSESSLDCRRCNLGRQLLRHRVEPGGHGNAGHQRPHGDHWGAGRFPPRSHSHGPLHARLYRHRARPRDPPTAAVRHHSDRLPVQRNRSRQTARRDAYRRRRFPDQAGLARATGLGRLDPERAMAIAARPHRPR